MYDNNDANSVRIHIAELGEAMKLIVAGKAHIKSVYMPVVGIYGKAVVMIGSEIDLGKTGDSTGFVCWI